MRVQIAAQRCTQHLTATAQLARGRFELLQVRRHLTRRCLGYDRGCFLTDTREFAQRPVRDASYQISGGQLTDHGRGTAESAHPISRLMRSLEQITDAIERVDRAARLLVHEADVTEQPGVAG